MRDAWPTGTISKPEVREELGKAVTMNIGGDNWKDLNLTTMKKNKRWKWNVS